MDAVMSVISALEVTTITKEQLEATRLAKYINQLRRRTKCEHLAKRAKSLLKKWREMVGIQQTSELPSSTTTLDNAVNSTNATTQINRNYSQLSSSPVYLVDNNTINSSKPNAQLDFCLTASNPAAAVSNISTTATRSANINNFSLVSKRKDQSEELVGGNSAPSATTAACLANQQPPISFANVLTGICGTKSGLHIVEQSGSKSNNHRSNFRPVKSKYKSSSYIRDNLDATETFIIDQSSNSNSQSGFTEQQTVVPPIIIDIQESNSNSNMAESGITSTTKEQPMLTSFSSRRFKNLQENNTLDESNFKHQQRHKNSAASTCSLIVIDESSNSGRVVGEECKNILKKVSGNESKLRHYPASNISGKFQRKLCSLNTFSY